MFFFLPNISDNLLVHPHQKPSVLLSVSCFWHQISAIVQLIAAVHREKPVTLSRVSGYIEPAEQPVTFGLHYTATGARESVSTKARLSLKYKDAIGHPAYRDLFIYLFFKKAKPYAKIRPRRTDEEERRTTKRVPERELKIASR